VLEHKKGFVARLAAAQRRRNSGTGGGERREAVGLGGEVLELCAIVDLGEIPATAPLERQAAMDATSPRGSRLLDTKRAGDR